MEWARGLPRQASTVSVYGAYKLLMLSPTHKISDTLGESLTIYQVVDENTAFSDASPHVADLERQLLARVDLVIASAESEDDLLKLLKSAPDPASREWTIVELFDGVGVIRQYLETLGRS